MIASIKKIFSNKDSVQNDAIEKNQHGVHRSIETLLQRDFIKIVNTGDLKYLMNNINDELPENISDIWEEIIDQHYLLTGDKSTAFNFKKMLKINDLVNKKWLVESLISMIIRGNQTSLNFERTKKALSKKGFIIDQKKDLFSEIKRLQKQVKSLEALIRIKKGELPKSESKEQINFARECVKLKIHYNIEVNQDTCTVEQWFFIGEEVKHLNNEKKQA